jgi:hypothetical protein
MWLKRVYCAIVGHHWYRLWSLAYQSPFERKAHRTHGWVCGRCNKKVDSIEKAR